ncbi:MAG: DUF2304 family protein [Patescibacteria group bacterium]
MLQQIIAIIIILFFIAKLNNQKKKKEISRNEFWLWLSFWILALVAIIFIKQIDNLVHVLGFSGSGINFLIYLAVMALFYLVFRLRLNIAKLDKNLTEVVRIVTINNKK